MIKHINAIIIRSAKPEAMKEFYDLIGLSLEKEDHGEGPVHYATDIGKIHFAIFPAKDKLTGKDMMIGFEVDDLETLNQKLKAAGVKFKIENQEVPWGKRSVVYDPEGREVELNQS